MEGDRGEGGFIGNIGEAGAGVRTDLRLQVHLLPAAVELRPQGDYLRAVPALLFRWNSVPCQLMRSPSGKALHPVISTISSVLSVLCHMLKSATLQQSSLCWVDHLPWMFM